MDNIYHRHDVLRPEEEIYLTSNGPSEDLKPVINNATATSSATEADDRTWLEPLFKMPDVLVSGALKYLSVERLHELELISHRMGELVKGAFMSIESLVVKNLDPRINCETSVQRQKLLNLVLRCGSSLKYLELRCRGPDEAVNDKTIQVLYAPQGPRLLADKCPNIEAFGSIIYQEQNVDKIVEYAHAIMLRGRTCKITSGVQIINDNRRLNRVLKCLPKLRKLDTADIHGLGRYVREINPGLRYLSIELFAQQTLITTDIEELVEIINGCPKLRTLILYIDQPIAKHEQARYHLGQVMLPKKVDVRFVASVVTSDFIPDNFAQAIVGLSILPSLNYQMAADLLRFKRLQQINLNNIHIARMLILHVEDFNELVGIRVYQFVNFSTLEHELIALFERNSLPRIRRLWIEQPVRRHREMIRAILSGRMPALNQFVLYLDLDNRVGLDLMKEDIDDLYNQLANGSFSAALCTLNNVQYGNELFKMFMDVETSCHRVVYKELIPAPIAEE